MNKKEVSEIKRHFNSDDGFLTVSKVMSAFVDTEKKIRCRQLRELSLLETSEAELILNALKKVFSGKLSKNLMEFAFPDECFAQGGAQNVIHLAVRSKLSDEKKAGDLLDRIVANVSLDSPYAVFVGACSYSVFKKHQDDREYEESDSSYNFIVAAFCPAAIREEGLVYDETTNSILKKPSSDTVVSDSPADGFIYPVFSCGGADVNRVMYYTKKPKTPNVSIISDLLGCKLVASPNEEKAVFQSILSNVVADELDLQVITSVNDKIAEVIAENQDDTDPPIIDKTRLTRILSESGVSDDKLETLDNVYDSVAGQTEMKATNLLENKTVVSVPDITVNIRKKGAEKVRLQTIGGRRCLIIDLDDPEVSVNGLICKSETKTPV